MDARRVLAAAVVVFTLSGPLCAQEREEPPKLSPYPAIRLAPDERPEVLFQDRWYALEAIDGHTTDELLAYCRGAYGDGWWKRFTEDLVEVLWALGKPHEERTVDLKLKDIQTGEVITPRDVLMTKENRITIWEAAMDSVRPGWRNANREPARRVERDHAPGVPERFEPLVRRFFDDHGGPRLTREQAEQDLDELEWRLTNEHSYTALRLRPAAGELREALDAIRAALGDGISLADFAVQLQKVIVSTGDGHAGVQSLRSYLLPGYAPFLVADTADGPVAFKEDRTGFLDEQRPFLRAIDGLPLQRWLDAAAALEADGSPHLERRRALGFLREVASLRRLLDLPASQTLRVELTDAQGGNAAELVLPLAEQRPVYGVWPRTGHRKLDGGVAYVRIPEMDGDDEFVGQVVDAVRRLAGPAGLVLDVRDNGGGSRNLLLALSLLLMRPGDDPVVVNAAVYRLRPGEEPSPEGHLDNRHLYPLISPRWSGDERAAIERFAAVFRPEVHPPDGAFSDWHYLVIGPGSDPQIPRYTGPVVILMNEGCFSATDIFLAALGELPNVTLIGTPSSGGSGRSNSTKLANSGLPIRLSSMASYQPSGLLFDGRGVAPDLLVHPRPADLLGRTDTALDAALTHLRNAAAPASPD